MRYLVTGGAGFIGSNLVQYLVKHEKDAKVMTYDKLTYAGRLENLAEVNDSPRHQFFHADINDRSSVETALMDFRPNFVCHLAAESHVDRSIHSADHFIKTNVLGTFNLVDACYRYWQELTETEKAKFRFLHVSTDEVYGALGDSGFFSEQSNYKPNSPYAATKAGSDMLVRSYYKTYGFPTIITNCSNNYGPYQYPEKLIPYFILNAIRGRDLPVYGDGKQIRDWIYVEDHVSALIGLLKKGTPGETYCIGGDYEVPNQEVVETICDILDELYPKTKWGSHHQLIKHVVDRLGHDRRYATDTTKLRRTLKWEPKVNFADGLRQTIIWYISDPSRFREERKRVKEWEPM